MTIVAGVMAVRYKWGTLAVNVPYMNASGANNNTTNTGAAIQVEADERALALRYLRVSRIQADVTSSIALFCAVIRGKLPKDISFMQNASTNTWRPTDLNGNPVTLTQLGVDLLYFRILSLSANPGEPSQLDPQVERHFRTGYGPWVNPYEFMTIIVAPMHVPLFTGLAENLSISLTALGGPRILGSAAIRSASEAAVQLRSIQRGALGS